MKSLQLILLKRNVVQRMAPGQPALRAVVQWIVVEARTAGERKDAGLYVGLFT